MPQITKPSLFIGSSTEGLEAARAIKIQLDDDADVELWNEGVFALGQSTLESMTQALNRFDFAILVLTADDTNVAPSTVPHAITY
jgi:predicted nucleotide-binding protein